MTWECTEHALVRAGQNERLPESLDVGCKRKHLCDEESFHFMQLRVTYPRKSNVQQTSDMNM